MLEPDLHEEQSKSNNNIESNNIVSLLSKNLGAKVYLNEVDRKRDIEAGKFWIRKIKETNDKIEDYNKKSLDNQIIDRSYISGKMSNTNDYIMVAIRFVEASGDAGLISELNLVINKFENNMKSWGKTLKIINEKYLQFYNSLDSVFKEGKKIIKDQNYYESKEFLDKIQKLKEEYKAFFEIEAQSFNSLKPQFMIEFNKCVNAISELYKDYLFIIKDAHTTKNLCSKPMILKPY